MFLFILKKFPNCSNTASKRQEMEDYKMRRLLTKQKNSQEIKLLYTDTIKPKIKMSVFTIISSKQPSKSSRKLRQYHS